MATSVGRQQLLRVESSCGSLLTELQLIWDEVGESDEERDKMLLELERECLEVYKRKVDQASHRRTHLHRAIAEIQTEIANIASILNDRPPIAEVDRRASLKEQLLVFTPLLEEISHKRDQRLKQFRDIKEQIVKIHLEINEFSLNLSEDIAEDDEKDLSTRKLDELTEHLQILQQEKNERLAKVGEYIDIISGLCEVMGCDFSSVINEVHPSLNKSSSKSISNETLRKLSDSVQLLKEEQRKRMQKLQDLATSLLELWNLMDTSMEEQQLFQHVTCNLAASEDEFTIPGCLSMDLIKETEYEVERLEQLKASRMKELVLKKQNELEEVCRKSHMILRSNTIEELSGKAHPAELLENLEEQIGIAKEEAFCRKDVLERVEKWKAACEEEEWLDDYNKDENRYNASRGAHLTLKRAERARATVSKIPGIVETLIAKIELWEEERGETFMYDGVRLLSTLEEYTFLRQQKEEEKRRQRDQRRLQEQLITQQETMYGSKPSPYRTPAKTTVALSRSSTPTSRRLSLGGGGALPSPHDIPRANAALLRPIDPKETRKEKTQRHAIETSLNQSSDRKDTANLARHHHLHNLGHTIDGTRQPLSPVSTPMGRSNKNLLQDFSSKGGGTIGSSPMKPFVIKNPANLSSEQQPVSSDEENNTPQQYSQPSPPNPMEYSFEERRVAFHLQNGLHLTTWG